VAVLVLQLGVGDVVLLGIGELDVTDRVGDLLDGCRDALIALAALAYRPVDRGADAERSLPRRRHLGQIGGEDAGRARRIGAVDRRDRRVRQLHVLVQPHDLRIVP
jgi:hypothetical protein